MSDLFDDGSDQYEEDKAASDAKILEGAGLQLDALGSDLDYLQSDDNVFTDRMDTADDKLSFSEKESTAKKDTTLSKITTKATSDADKITSFDQSTGFEGSGASEANRVALSESLKVAGSEADRNKFMADQAATIKWEGDLKNVESDWYKSLRLLQNEMLAIKTEAEGATGDSVNYSMPDWDEIFDNA